VPIRLEADPAALSARITDADRVAHALMELSRSRVVVSNFALGQPSLDEVFLALTGRVATPQANGDSPAEEASA
jgi:ABC-2 type transport system ATP-binding protein